MSHELPGTDPRFHETRNYMSPIILRGREILAHHGSCKQEGCGYHSAWTTRAARDRGMWTHRALRVREARTQYFNGLNLTEMQALRLQKETADCHSHFFSPWRAHVQTFYRELAGDDEMQLPDYDYYNDYGQGNSALSTAQFLFEGALR